MNCTKSCGCKNKPLQNSLQKTRRAFESYFAAEINVDGKGIHGKLAHAGWSRNGRVYPPATLAAVPQTLPLLLNHATSEGTTGIPPSLLPPSYLQRLQKGERIQVGESKMTWVPENLELIYESVVTDPHFSNPRILKHMNVSLGLLFTKEQLCDPLACYDLVTNPIWDEMSLVFSPGFASATLTTESNGSLSLKSVTTNQMSNDNTKSTEAIPPGGQPDATVTDASNCPEGSAFNTETGKCEEVPKENPMSNPGAPDVVDKVSEQNLDDDDDDDKKSKKGEEGFATIPELDALYPVTEGMVFKDNVDLKSERERTEKYLKAIELASRYQQTGQIQKGNDLLEAELKKMDLTHKLNAAKESARKKALVPKAKPAMAIEMDSAKEFVVPNHALQWYNAVAKRQDVIPSKIYSFNKQHIFENMSGRYYKQQKLNALTGGWEMSLTPMTGDQKKATEVLSGPAAADFLQTMSEQVIVDPNGEFITPFRQFANTVVLAPGQKEGLFYDIDKVKFGNVVEGGSGVPASNVTIRSAGGETSPRGALVDINYSQVEEIPFDVVAKINEGYALESVIDEGFDALNTKYNDDTANVGGNRKQPGGGVKDNWVNGNTGAVNPTDTAAGLGKLTFAGLLKAKTLINNKGFRTPNKVTYLNEKGIEDLVTDPGIDSFIQFSRPAIIEEGTVEKIAGTNLVSASVMPTDSGSANNLRAVMFVPNVSFGLVTGRDLTMEAQRRNEFQVIKLTGTQKIASYVKMQESTSRISYTAV